MPSGGKATITPPLPHPSLCPWKLCVYVTLRIIAQEFRYHVLLLQSKCTCSLSIQIRNNRSFSIIFNQLTFIETLTKHLNELKIWAFVWRAMTCSDPFHC